MCPNKTSWMESSNAAIRALSLMLVQGKDDIYFYFDGDEKECEYFMIPALDVQLSRAVTERNEKRMRDLFDTLLRTNLMKYDLTAAGDTECPG